MKELEVTAADLAAISMIDVAFEKAFFPMIEGSEVQNLAQSRVRIRALRLRLAQHVDAQNAKTKDAMESKLAKSAQPKDPVKKHGHKL